MTVFIPPSWKPAVLLFHCASATCEGVEWDSVSAGEGCWMCGGQGVQGRVPLPDGKSPPNRVGVYKWKAGDITP